MLKNKEIIMSENNKSIRYNFKTPRFYNKKDKDLIVMSNLGFLLYLYGLTAIGCLLTIILLEVAGVPL